MADVVADIRNNLVWNHTRAGTQVRESGTANIIRNYYRGAASVTDAVQIQVLEFGKVHLSGNHSHNGFNLNDNAPLIVAFPVEAQHTPATYDAITAAHQVKTYAGARGINFGLDAIDQAIVDSITGLPAAPGAIPAPPGETAFVAKSEPPLTLLFGIPQDGLMRYFGNVMPTVEDLTTTPAVINLGAMDRSSSALGQREAVTIRFANHKHSDHLVDKYRLERRDTALQSYVWFPGSSGNYASTPDSAANSITGDIDIRVQVSLDDWNAEQNMALVAKRTQPTQHSFRFGFNNQSLSWAWSTGGSTMLFMEWTVLPIVPSSGKLWVRFTFDVDNGASGRTGTVYTSTDYNAETETGTWTQLGAPITQSGVTSIFNSTSRLTIGAWDTNGTTQRLTGKVYYAEMRNGINGTVVSRFDPNDGGDGATEFVSGLGENWTIHQSGTPSAELVAPQAFEPTGSGTFWGKWLARNRYYPNYPLRVYEGRVNFLLRSMLVRHYVIDKITGPSSEGYVTLTAKDYFSRVEARKAVAPKASRGELQSNIGAGDGAFTLRPVGIGNIDYPTSGRVRIGDEIIQFTRSGDAMTVVQRAALNTAAQEHKAEDLVQLVLSYTAMEAHDIVYDLLTQYSTISATQIGKGQWDTAAISMTSLYTAHIAEPTPVLDLVGELSEIAGFTVFPNVTTKQIEFVPLHASAPVLEVTDDMIIDGTLAVAKQEAKRVSQVWVYYGQRDPTQSVDDPKNYSSRLVVADLEAESETQYGAPAIREVFGRWIPQFGREPATDTGERILAMYVNPPIDARFAVRSEDAATLKLAQLVTLRTTEVEDDVGRPLAITGAVTSIERTEVRTDLRLQGVSFSSQGTDPGVGERVIRIENNIFDFNLRAVHDSLYRAPESGQVVRLVLAGGTFVGSTNISTAAIDTGLWPDGVQLLFENQGHAQGKGGAAGGGGNPFSGAAGGNGQQGGVCFRARHPISIDNTNGRLWGGGGGGGGGGAVHETFIFLQSYAGGGGGGGGSGHIPGSGGSPGPTQVEGMAVSAGAGASGTTNAGGGGGSGLVVTLGNTFGSGGGGRGGNLGEAGASGTTGFADDVYPAGSGGAAGPAVVGNSFITWLGVGDRRGPVT